MDHRSSCLMQVPYNSVIAFVLIFVGGGVLCGSLYHAIARVDLFFTNHLFPVYSLSYVRIAAAVLGSVVIVLALLVVIFSTLVTKATRGHIYRGDRFIMGGRMSAALFLYLTYSTIIIWLVFLGFLVVPTFCWIMFNSICTTELAGVWHGPGARRPGPDGRVAPTFEELQRRNKLMDDTYSARLAYYYPDRTVGAGFIPPGLQKRPLDLPLVDEKGRPYSMGPYSNRIYDLDFRYIFNLTNYGIYLKPWLYDESLNYREAITNLETFASFCDEVAIVGPLFACSLAGAAFVLFGLILFIGALAGFYTRLKLTKELTDFKQSIALRSPKSADHAAYF